MQGVLWDLRASHLQKQVAGGVASQAGNPGKGIAQATGKELVGNLDIHPLRGPKDSNSRFYFAV